MAWFGRKGNDREVNPASQNPGATAADGSLSVFTVEDAARFRAMVREVAAEHGREVTVHAGHVVDDAGNGLGLWNLAAICAADEDHTQWRLHMATHFDRLFNPQGADVASMDEATLLASVYARLVGEDSLPRDIDRGAHSLDRWARGIHRILAVDTPTTVLTVPFAELEARAPRAVLVDQGWRNTRALLDSEELVADRVEHDGRWFTCVLGDSFFTASLALMLPDVATRFEPDVDHERGIIFPIPYRHQLNYRVVTDGESALSGLMLIPRFAALGFSDSPGPVSPHTFFWREGAITCLTEFDGEGHLAVTPGPYLEELLTEGQLDLAS